MLQRHIIKQYNVLITAKTTQVITRTQATLNPIGNLNQYLITGLMAQTVIDQFKAVKADKEHSSLARARLALTLQSLRWM